MVSQLFTCPNALQADAQRDRLRRHSDPCLACRFGPSVPKSLAARALMRSSIMLEPFACLADAERVHLRVANPPWTESA